MMLSFIRSRIIVFFTLVCIFSGFQVEAAYAQNYRAQIGGGVNGARTFPDIALRGKLQMQEYPYVLLDGKRELLAPATRIIDTSNRIVVHSMVPQKKLDVNYIRHSNGQLHTVWLLTEQEALEKRKGADGLKWWQKLYDKVEPLIDLATWLGLKELGL